MNKTELEKAIKNGESVWVVDDLYKTTSAIHLNKTFKITDGRLDGELGDLGIKGARCSCFIPIEEIFATKQQAEHYLHHANVVRTEELPFLTWEEFKNGKNITFKAKNGHEFLLKAKQESIYLWWLDTNNIWKTWDLTEANFYKAYDECVRLFKGGGMIEKKYFDERHTGPDTR